MMLDVFTELINRSNKITQKRLLDLATRRRIKAVVQKIEEERG